MWPSLATISSPPARQSPRKIWSQPASEIKKVRSSHRSSKTFIHERCSNLASRAGANPDDIRLGSSGRKSMKRRLYRGADYRRAQNIEELRGIARRRMPNFSFEYVEG